MSSFKLKLFLLIICSLCLILPLYARQTSHYDVIVIGSEPEGISAAVASSRNNSKVMLIDHRAYVGGLYTSGMLSMLDMNYITANTFETVNAGFFKEFYEATAVQGNIDIEKTKKYFTTLLEKEKIQTVLNADAIHPIKKNNTVIGLSYIQKGRRYKAYGTVFIDSSTDAGFSRKAGAPYRVGREELGLGNHYAAATLVFSVKGVDWDKVKNYLNSDHLSDTGANAKVAWGYPDMLNYAPHSTQFQLRKLNLSLQDDGSVVVNAFQIFNTDSLDSDSIKHNYEAGVKELPHVVAFLKEHAVGFEKAELYKHADELYIREGVRIIGEYTLTGEDIFNSTDFKNKIAYGSYPMDLQSIKKDGLGGVSLTARNIYSLPITIMVPKKIENLLIASRSASYDPLAHSSARTVPVGMALGQAAGVLASYSSAHSLSVRTCSLDDFHIKNIQLKLISSGVTLNTPLNTSHPEKSSWAYPYIQALRKKGFLSMTFKFQNTYRCKEAASVETISSILSLVHANSPTRLPILSKQLIDTDNELTISQIIVLFNDFLGTTYQSLSELHHAHIIDETTFKHLENKSQLLNEDVYALMYHLIETFTLLQS